MGEEFDEYGVPILKKQQPQEVDEYGVPILKKEQRIVSQRPQDIKAETPEELRAKWPSQVTRKYNTLEEELQDIDSRKIKDAPVNVAVAHELSSLEKLYNKAYKREIDPVISQIRQYQRERAKELSTNVRSEDDRKRALRILELETDNLIKKKTEEVEYKVKPFYDAYSNKFNSPESQMVMQNPSMALGFYETYDEEYNKMTDGERALHNLTLRPLQRAGYSALVDLIPGSLAGAAASTIEKDYDSYIAQQFVPAPVGTMGRAVAISEADKKKAVDNYIKRVGLEQYQKEKEAYTNKQVSRQKALLNYQAKQEGEAAGRLSTYAPDWETTKGALGVSEYIQKNIGQTLGLGVPTVVTSLVNPTLGGLVSAGLITGIEKGIAYKESLKTLEEELKKQQPDITLDQILQQDLDSTARNASTRAGIINGALEYIGQLSVFGKFIKPNFISDLINQATKIKGVNMTVGTFMEGLTEWLQAKNTNYQANLASGMPADQAANLAFEKDDAEEFIAGLTGGTLSVIQAFSPSEKKAAKIDVIINDNADTGSQEINEIIDTNAKYDQKEQVGVPSAEQQGAAPIQEGAQPEGGTAEAQAGGVLQVPGEAPGAQAEVTPEVTPTEDLEAEGLRELEQLEQPTPPVAPAQFDVKEQDILKPRTLSKDLTLFHYSSDPELTREKIDPLRVGVSQMKRRYVGKPEGERPAGFYATLSPNSFYGRLEEAEGVPVPKTGAKTPYAISLSDVNFYDITEEFSPSDRIPQARLKELKDQGVDVVLGRGMVGEPEFIILNQEKITDVKKIDETAKQELVQKYGKTRPKYTTEDISVLKSQVTPAVQPTEQLTATEFNATTAVDEFMPMYPKGVGKTTLTRTKTGKKRGRPRSVKVTEAAEVRAVATENIADFLRDKVTSKEQVSAFVNEYNSRNPDNQIPAARAEDAWKLIAPQKPKAETAVVKINDMIRQQAAIRARGKAQGVIETTKVFRNNLIKKVQDSIKESNLTPNQINSILSAVKRVNLFTPGSISKLAEKIREIEQNAELADKIRDAKILRNRIKSLAKVKDDRLENYTRIAKDFLQIDTDYLTEYSEGAYNGIPALDAYIQAATAITNGFANPKLDKYERILVSEINGYINAQLDYKERQQTSEIAEDLGEEDRSKVIDGASLSDFQKLIDTLQLAQRAEELQEQLRTVDNPNGILNTLNSADINKLDIDQLSMFIRVADNVIANEDYSMVDRFSNVIKSRENIEEMERVVGSATKEKLVPGLKNLEQITQMLDGIFNISKYAAYVYNLSGIYDYIAGTARVENKKIAMAKDLQKAIEKIDSKNMGKPQLLLRTEQAKLLMLSELGKYTVDSTEHIEKIHENIQNSINKWKEQDAEFGNEIQQIYDGYKYVTSAEKAIEEFKKKDPHVHELWKYISNNVFTKELTDEVEQNTKSVFNRVFTRFVNYMPTALRTMEIEAAPAEVDRKSAKPVQAGTTREAKRIVTSKQAYDFKNYINDILYAYTETIHDVETSKHLQLFNNVANNPKFKEIVGGVENKNAIINRVISTDKIERKMTDQVDESMSVLNKIADGISQIGVTTALGGLDQIALQYPSAAMSTMIMLGSDADLFFAAPTSMNKELTQAVNKILSKQDIAVRGQAHKYELSSKSFDLKSKNEIFRDLSKIRKGLGFIQRDILLKPLILSDLSVAQRSYMAFYLQSLRQQGIKGVDLANEHEKMNEPSRKQAVAYASLMLSNLQVASTSAGRSAFVQTPGNLGIVRKLIFPFSSFPINTKIRMIRAINKLYSSADKKEGFKEFLAVFTEAATFSAIKIYMLPFYYAAVKAGMESIAGFESPEDEEEDEDKQWRKLKTQMALEAIPFNIGSAGAFGSQWLVNRLNYMVSETDARTTAEFLKNMGEDPMFERLQNWNKYNEFYGYGQYGIGMDRYADIVNASLNYFRDDYITLETGYGEQIVNKDSDELARMAMINMWIQLLPSPRELRTQMDKIQREQFKIAKERQSD